MSTHKESSVVVGRRSVALHARGSPKRVAAFHAVYKLNHEYSIFSTRATLLRGEAMVVGQPGRCECQPLRCSLTSFSWNVFRRDGEVAGWGLSRMHFQE